MDKVFREYYTPIVYAMWVVWIPMVVNGEVGFIPGLCSAIVAAAIGWLLTSKTANSSRTIKTITLTGSVVAIVAFTILIAKPRTDASDSSIQSQSE